MVIIKRGDIMKDFRITIKQVTRYGTFKDSVIVGLSDIKKVLPKKIRDEITDVNALNELEKVTVSIEEL